MSYRDAVRLLGGSDSRIVETLDRVTGGLLLAASATGNGLALSLFDAKGELARLSAGLVSGLGTRLRGLSRFERSERLAAAHAVVVLTAYFEALSRAELPFDPGDLEIDASEQVALAGGGPPGSNRLGALAAGLLAVQAPMPAPQWPYEVTLETLRDFYAYLSNEVIRFVAGSAVWDRLDDTRKQRFTRALSDDLPDRAVPRYEELFRQLAAEFPEVAFWANAVDHQATRELLRDLSRGLEGLERVLRGIATGRMPDERRAALSRAYQAALRRPILTSGDAPEGVRLPLLGAAYVNPDFQAAEVGPAERIAEESWWLEQPVWEDLQGFLLGHLTATQAARAPLLVLGQPGSGKSVLTTMLAARLPPSEFLAVRVELREVPADADLQSQIEHAIRATTGETLTWPELARGTGDALPVVLLDGFDELLQATGVSQTDYLHRVVDFQRREADQGRPVAVLVTSRTAVADRARLVDGMVAVRLEPFSDSQIAQWLEVWNEANAESFAARGLRPLLPETVVEHGELAAQPLLLLMLALYDADRNALQESDTELSWADLYERLLTSFAEREIGRTGASLPPERFDQLVEDELTNLSVVAFAMFNRGRQWITEAELDADLAALHRQLDHQAATTGLRARLTAAEVMIGRFFFVHEGQAIRDDRRLKSYEFLHATFGEYLVARLVTKEVAYLAEVAGWSADRGRRSPVDDAFLHALLSFMPLTMRGTIVSFACERLRALPEARREPLRDLLLGLFHEALEPRHDTRYGDYAPQPLPVPARPAAYSANLLLLAVVSAGELLGGDLFPAAADRAADWRRIALLWRSQLPAEGWTGLVETLLLDRLWDDGRRELKLRPRWEEPESWRSEPYWSYGIAPEDGYRPRRPGEWFSWIHLDPWLFREQARFLCDTGDDTFVHALEPLADELRTMIATFFDSPERQRPVSAVNALITLWLASGQRESSAELADAYDTCLRFALFGFAPTDPESRHRFRLLFLHQLAVDRERLDPAWLRSAMAAIGDGGKGKAEEEQRFLRAAHDILPRALTEHLPDP
ncbi:MAG TPA: ATP-binding protein [Nonomuraea sp.]|nr:ATP-binding protein [Nonomuraea sp.]